MSSLSDIVQVRGYVCPTGHGRNYAFVAVETRDGVVGFGEGSQSDQDEAVLANVRQVGRILCGESIFGLIERLALRLRTARAGRAMSVAVSAVETAVWDALGKTLGVPVFQLLGGRVEESVQCYATLAAGIDDWSAVSIAGHAREAVGEGYGGVKVLPLVGMRRGGFVASEAVAVVETVRGAIGPEPRLMIECNFGLDTVDALRLARLLEPYECYWIEAPLRWDDPQELARLRSRISQRVASGETAHGREAYRDLLELHAVDVVQPDVKWTGGIFEAKKVAAWAEAYRIDVAPHNNSGPVATAASAHLTLTLPNAVMLETPWVKPDWEMELTRGTGVVENGRISAEALADRPGFGVEVDERLARRLAEDGGALIRVEA